MKNILTIAGSDSCGGAGIQADIKTFCAHGTYAMSVITAVTAQNTCGVTDVQDIDSKIIEAQLDAVFTDICVDAVKIGMLSSSKIIHVVAEKLQLYKPKIIVLDPVMISKSGYKLLKQESVGLLISKLLPLVTVVTPNIPEAETICDMKISNEDNAIKALYMIYSMGAKNVLLKGGHLDGDPVDRLYDGNKIYSFNSERINTKNTHGTGCTLSSAIAANLALGYDIQKAVELSKMYVVGIGLCNYIAVLPIITFFCRKQNGFIASVGFAFVYGFCGIFVAGRSLTDFYPITAGLGISGYTGQGTVPYNTAVGCLVLLVMLIVSAALIRKTPNYDEVIAAPKKQGKSGKRRNVKHK